MVKAAVGIRPGQQGGTAPKRTQPRRCGYSGCTVRKLQDPGVFRTVPGGAACTSCRCRLAREGKFGAATPGCPSPAAAASRPAPRGEEKENAPPLTLYSPGAAGAAAPCVGPAPLVPAANAPRRPPPLAPAAGQQSGPDLKIPAAASPSPADTASAPVVAHEEPSHPAAAFSQLALCVLTEAMNHMGRMTFSVPRGHTTAHGAPLSEDPFWRFAALSITRSADMGAVNASAVMGKVRALRDEFGVTPNGVLRFRSMYGPKSLPMQAMRAGGCSPATWARSGGPDAGEHRSQAAVQEELRVGRAEAMEMQQRVTRWAKVVNAGQMAGQVRSYAGRRKRKWGDVDLDAGSALSAQDLSCLRVLLGADVPLEHREAVSHLLGELLNVDLDAAPVGQHVSAGAGGAGAGPPDIFAERCAQHRVFVELCLDARPFLQSCMDARRELEAQGMPDLVGLLARSAAKNASRLKRWPLFTKVFERWLQKNDLTDARGVRYSDIELDFAASVVDKMGVSGYNLLTGFGHVSEGEGPARKAHRSEVLSPDDIRANFPLPSLRWVKKKVSAASKRTGGAGPGVATGAVASWVQKYLALQDKGEHVGIPVFKADKVHSKVGHPGTGADGRGETDSGGLFTFKGVASLPARQARRAWILAALTPPSDGESERAMRTWAQDVTAAVAHMVPAAREAVTRKKRQLKKLKEDVVKKLEKAGKHAGSFTAARAMAGAETGDFSVSRIVNRGAGARATLLSEITEGESIVRQVCTYAHNVYEQACVTPASISGCDTGEYCEPTEFRETAPEVLLTFDERAGALCDAFYRAAIRDTSTECIVYMVSSTCRHPALPAAAIGFAHVNGSTSTHALDRGMMAAVRAVARAGLDSRVIVSTDGEFAPAGWRVDPTDGPLTRPAAWKVTAEALAKVGGAGCAAAALESLNKRYPQLGLAPGDLDSAGAGGQPMAEADVPAGLRAKITAAEVLLAGVGDDDEARALGMVVTALRSQLQTYTRDSVNINTASAAQLKGTLQDVGDTKAKAIVTARLERTFDDVSELSRVKGISKVAAQLLAASGQARTTGEAVIKGNGSAKKATTEHLREVATAAMFVDDLDALAALPDAEQAEKSIEEGGAVPAKVGGDLRSKLKGGGGVNFSRRRLDRSVFKVRISTPCGRHQLKNLRSVIYKGRKGKAPEAQRAHWRAYSRLVDTGKPLTSGAAISRAECNGCNPMGVGVAKKMLSAECASLLTELADGTGVSALDEGVRAELHAASEFAAACGAFDVGLDPTGYTTAERQKQLEFMKAYLVDGEETANTGAYVRGIPIATFEATLVLVESWIVILRWHVQAGDGSAPFFNGRAINTDDVENFFSRMQHVTPERFRQKFNRQSIEFKKRARDWDDLGYHYPLSNSIYKSGGCKKQRFNDPTARQAPKHAASLEEITPGGQHDAPFRRATGATLTKGAIARFSALQQEPTE